MRSITAAAAGAALAVGLVGSADASETDVLLNGSFEEGRAPWWGPGRWDIVPGAGVGGSAALQMEYGFACQDKRPVTGGRRYKVTMLVRCEGAPDGSVFAQLSYRGPGVDPGWYGPVKMGGEAALLSTGGSHGWKEFSVVVETPGRAGELVIYLRKQNGTPGAAWYDDVAVTPADEPAMPSANAPMTGPIILNGDFEEGAAHWWGPGGWAVVRGEGVGGSAALRLEKGFACQDRRPVQGGSCCRISVRLRCEQAAPGAAYVQLSYRGPGVDAGWRGLDPVKLAGGRSEPALFVAGGTHGWKQFSVVVEAPRNADQMLLYLRKQDGPGAALFDEVTVEPTDEKPFTAADKRRAELAAELLPPALPARRAERALAEAAALGAGAAARLTVAEGGRAACRVHVGTAADVMTLAAARDLARYLGRMTGGDFGSMSHDAAALAGPLIVVGRDGALAARLLEGVDWAALGNDGFIIRSVGRHLVIAGNTPRGTMYGVHWLLDRDLGVNWLSPSCIRVPKRPSIAIPPQDQHRVPRFKYREILSVEGQDKRHRSRNLLNGESHGPSFSPTPPEYDSWEHDWQARGGYANFFELLPQKTYARHHPEWYAGGQLAMMDTAMRDEMARVVVERLRAHLDYRRIWFNIHDMDRGWDMDPASEAFADRHGGHPSAPRLDMVIDVARQVRAALPGARLAFNAYHWSFTPPEGMTVPDHVLVFPMTIHVDYGSPLNAGRNVALGRDIAGWAKIAKTVQVWDHITNWSGFLQPTPNIYPIGESIRWLASLPTVRGYFAEGSWNTPAAEFAALRVWVMARLLWDPSLDTRALVAEFCDDYYGRAGPKIARYIDLMHEALKHGGDVIAEKFQPDLAMYDLDFVTAADRLFDEAEAAAAGDAQSMGNVREARMPVDFIILVRRHEYAQAARERGLRWTVDTERRMARFKATVAERKVRAYRQGMQKGELDELLAVERRTSAPHVMVRGLPRGDWVELQDLSVNRYADAVITSDPLASDGAAVRMGGRHSVWAIQLKPYKLPREGRWDLYAEVRVEAEPGHEGEPGVRVGWAPPMNRFVTNTVGQLSSYRLVRVPGGPFRFANDHSQSMYLQPPARKWLTYVWLDRVIAVRRSGAE